MSASEIHDVITHMYPWNGDALMDRLLEVGAPVGEPKSFLQYYLTTVCVVYG